MDIGTVGVNTAHSHGELKCNGINSNKNGEIRRRSLSAGRFQVYSQTVEGTQDNQSGELFEIVHASITFGNSKLIGCGINYQNKCCNHECFNHQ